MDRGNDQASGMSNVQRRDLRQATLVVPETGARVRRKFTLLSSPTSTSVGNGHGTNGQTPLPTTQAPKSPPVTWRKRVGESFPRLATSSKQWALDFVKSRNGQGVFKCSIAYVLATMAVFVPSFSKLLGPGDGKHLVANIVVWFHPARSGGSMDQGTEYACIAFVYATVVCYGSMGIVYFFRLQEMLQVGHVVVLIVGCGGGLGFLAWTKQRLNDLLVNVSCSLAAVPIVTTLTKDSATQDGYFSHNNVSSVLRMMVMALIISFLVNTIVRPVSARKDLRDNLVKTTDAFADLLAGITSGFLSGSEDDMKHPKVVAATDKFNTVYGALDSNLREARFEHYVLGSEMEYSIETELVRCVQRLAQDIGGLRSAAAIEFGLLAESKAKDPAGGKGKDLAQSPTTMTPTGQKAFQIIKPDNASSGSSDRDDPIFSTPSQQDLSASQLKEPSAASTADIFMTFIDNLGPPMKSLAFTLKQILNELPFGPPPQHKIMTHQNFKSSLLDAMDLFNQSRKAALILVYKSRAVTVANSVHVAADFEEVAASCGHFSSSLQDLAENTVAYLGVLDRLDLQTSSSYSRRSWSWLRFWRTRPGEDDVETPRVQSTEAEHLDADFPYDMPSVATRRYAQKQRENQRPTTATTLRYKVWKFSRFFRRDDIRYAAKVGIGGITIAVWAYVPATQAFFHEWRMEWALNVYMFVCAMTIGAANTTVLPRLQGTAIGAGLAIIVWIVAQGNVYALAVLGWCVSLMAFYIMLVMNQGPMSRFILLTYNLSVLYSYSISINDVGRSEDDNDEGGIDPQIWQIVWHRLVAVTAGILWGLFITQAIWPVSARRKLKGGLSLLLLRMGLVWKRGPLSVLVEGEPKPPSYMDIREELKLRQFADFLDAQRKAAESEFMMRGPFPSESYSSLLKSTGRMLDGFHALNVLITKDLKSSPGETAILKYTTTEREQLARRISHLFSVLASSVKLEYPLNDTIPEITHTRDRLLAQVFHFRQDESSKLHVTDEDYELLYAYALVTAQIAKEIDASGKVIENLYGTLNEDMLQLR